MTPGSAISSNGAPKGVTVINDHGHYILSEAEREQKLFDAQIRHGKPFAGHLSYPRLTVPVPETTAKVIPIIPTRRMS